jgi:NAD(P) transhydrogenase subunit alpha
MMIITTTETVPHETRTALTPQTAHRFIAKGFEAAAEQGCGHKASFSDREYQDVGIKLETDKQKLLSQADLWLKVTAPTTEEISLLSSSATVAADMSTLTDTAHQLILQKHIKAFALEKLPRISRAQPFDILSSQNNLAGYRAVIQAAYLSGRCLPMMITSAGTVNPVNVLVIGLGVAGLQAVATARRLGAKIYVSDPKTETHEQAKSLGAVVVEDIKSILPQCSIVITAAFGYKKHAPLIITDELLNTANPSTVFIDMASEYGGNIVHSQNLKTIHRKNCLIYGNSHLENQIPHTASLFLATNFYNFTTQILCPYLRAELSEADEIITQTLITES